jgi:hypothetical protein
MTVTLDTRACLFTPTKETDPEPESLEELIQQIQQTRNILQSGRDSNNDADSNPGWEDPVFNPEVREYIPISSLTTFSRQDRMQILTN